MMKTKFPLMRLLEAVQIVFFTLLLFAAQAQDAHFSQPFASPILQNPALTGLYDGDLKASIQFREQWASVLQNHAYKTYAFGVEKKFFGPGNDFFNVGLQLLHDEAGTSNFERNEVHLALSYQKLLVQSKGASHYISAGGAFGGGQIRMANQSLWFSRQYNPEQISIDPTVGSGENILSQNLQTDIFMDVSVGVMYYAVFDDQKSIYAGGSIHHLNQPSLAFTPSSNDFLFSRMSFQVGGELPINLELSVLPSVTFWSQGPYFESAFGGTFRYQNSDWSDVALRFGPSLRYVNRIDGVLLDAFILESRIEITNWSFGLSYDINVSGLNLATRSKGALEFSFIYSSKSNSYNPKVKCPKF